MKKFILSAIVFTAITTPALSNSFDAEPPSPRWHPHQGVSTKSIYPLSLNNETQQAWEGCHRLIYRYLGLDPESYYMNPQKDMRFGQINRRWYCHFGKKEERVPQKKYKIPLGKIVQDE